MVGSGATLMMRVARPRLQSTVSGAASKCRDAAAITLQAWRGTFAAVKSTSAYGARQDETAPLASQASVRMDYLASRHTSLALKSREQTYEMKKDSSGSSDVVLDGSYL